MGEVVIGFMLHRKTGRCVSHVSFEGTCFDCIADGDERIDEGFVPRFAANSFSSYSFDQILAGDPSLISSFVCAEVVELID